MTQDELMRPNGHVYVQDSSMKLAYEMPSTNSDLSYVQIEKYEVANTVHVKKSRLREKLYHVSAVVVLVALSHMVVNAQWLLPPFYAGLLPIIILIRIAIYFNNKWQYFLLDFCYYANAAWYIFIWIADSPRFFAVLFGIANGPLLWAMVVYRNSLVFHSHDKCSSSFIHILPGLLSFVIRWYPVQASSQWVKAFRPGMLEWEPEMLIWLFLLPFACFILHSGMYALIVHVLKKPGPEHCLSFNYLGTKKEGCLFKLFNCCGERCRGLTFYLCNWLFCFLTLIGVMLAYNFFVAHCVLLTLLALAVVYNGASYYMHIFSVRGFVDELE